MGVTPRRKGARVLFQSTRDNWIEGTVVDPGSERRVGVQFDHKKDGDIVYVDPQHLKPTGKVVSVAGVRRLIPKISTTRGTITSVSRSGRSASGKPLYRITLSDGRVFGTTADSEAVNVLTNNLSRWELPREMTLVVTERGTVANLASQMYR